METIELQTEKRKFIKKELHGILLAIDPIKSGRSAVMNKILSLSIQGAFMTRGGKRVYKENITDNEKIIVKEWLKDILKNTELKDCNDEYLVHKIIKIAKQADCHISYLLNEKHFRIGISQKLINLFLKYQWCLGWSVKPPPHCPFDGQIIAYLQKNVKDIELKQEIQSIRWTKMDNEEDYNNLVKSATEVYKNEGHKSIAEWELKVWNSWNEKKYSAQC